MKPILLTASLMFVLAGCHPAGLEMIELKGSPQALCERFNLEKDRVRVVALLSPV